jgi:photosystem II stability/assembly factor-like uncharacterized protein
VGGIVRVTVLVTLGVCVVGATYSVAAASPGRPRVLGQSNRTPAVIGQPAPTGTGQLNAVSCATAARCWAVGTPGATAGAAAPTAAADATDASTSIPAPPGFVIDATIDGGRTWVGLPLNLTPSPALEGIACPSARRCMAVGLNGAASAGVVLTTDDAGTTWNEVASPAGAIVVSSVACSTAGDCTVIASDGTTFWSADSADFGHSWQREGALPTGLEDAGDMSCLGVELCLVTGFTATTTGHGQGAIVVSTDGGATWSAADVPAGTGLLQSAICVTVTSCLATGTTSTTVSAVVPAKGALLESADGGHTWAPSSGTSSIDDIYGVACPTSRVCVMVGTKWIGKPAVGTGAVAQRQNSTGAFTASETEYTPLPLTALACPSAQRCVAVGGDTVARIAITPTATPAARHATHTRLDTPVTPTHLPPLTGGR